MTNSNSESVSAATEPAPPPEVPAVRIVVDIPIVFADGVISHSYAPGIAKFFLYRNNSDPFVSVPNKNVIVAQVVMQAEGFAKAVHFFNHRLKLMVRDGSISQEAMERITSIEYETPDKPNA